LNPKQAILDVRRYLNDLGPASEQPLLGEYVSQQAMFQCTTCGACEYQCPVGIQHLPIFIGLRRGAVNTGSWEDNHGGKLFLALERGSNALGISTTERDKFIEKNALPIYDGTQEYCLWLGCMGAYDPKGREIVVALVQVMNYLGVTFGVLRKEKCSGDPVRRLGNDLLFQQLAEANLEALQSSKTKRIITICPHCVRTIQEDWKEFGTPPPVEHHSEFLARYADRIPKQPGEEKIVFHDPCYLGRYRGVYDEPRTVASLAGQVIDPPRSHERSFCCGAGGGLAFLGEESGERVSHVRARELAETGAEVVGAACPFCNTMFRDALAAQGSGAPQLLDIAQLAARGLPRDGTS
jgi:Fe-S oxidoreductase